MEDRDLETFAATLGTLAIGLRHDLSENPGELDFYWTALKDLTIEQFNEACNRAGRECKFFPKVAVLRDLAGVMTAAELANVAWSQVTDAVIAHGRDDVDFDDKAINAAIHSMGGWQQLCNSKEEWFNNWGAKQFREAYTAYASKGVPKELSGPLKGRRFDVKSETKRIPATSSQVLSLPPGTVVEGPAPGHAIDGRSFLGELQQRSGRDGRKERQGDDGVHGTVESVLQRARQARAKRQGG